MELRQIEYFIEVAKREHVTEAAHALHVAQSAVSRQIFNLEKELGVDLFIREGRNVRLTPIGKIFLEHMKDAMKVMHNAKREIREFLDPEKGTIRIGFPSSMATYTLPTAISAFREHYPKVNFAFNQGSYHQLIEQVTRGEIDMALLGPVPDSDRRIKSEVLFYEDIVALLPASHPLAGEEEISLEQLREDPFILLQEGYVLRDLVDNACLQVGFSPKVSFEGNDIDAIKGLVSTGLGVTLIPEITLVGSLPRQTVTLPIADPELKRTVGVITAKEREMLPTEKVFHEF